MRQNITINTINPQPAPEVIPGYVEKVRLQASGHRIGCFTTQAGKRRIPLLSGEIIIKDEGRQNAAASDLTLDPPVPGSPSESGSDGTKLRITSVCNYR